METNPASGSNSSGAPGDIAPGTTFCDYRIVRLLGRGGMGDVYEVEHLHLGRRQALKVLPLELAREAGFRDRFRREARVLAGLEHPHIVTVHHASESAGRFFLAMELLPGSLSLAMPAPSQRGAGGGLPPPERVVEVMRQVLSALTFAHQRGVVHCDLKPANILIDPRGSVKLADFGVARALGSEFVRTMVERTIAQARAAEGETRVLSRGADSSFPSGNGLVGTLDYMAPEVRAGATADGRADLFALGVIGYEMLTGRKPLGRFRNVTALVPALDARWDELINRALEPDAEDRWPDAPAMADCLASIAAEGGPKKGELPLSPEPLRPQPPPLPLRKAGGPVAGNRWVVPDPRLEMVWIAPGQFTMGSPPSEPGHYEEESPQTQVTLTRGFWLGQYETTQGQWEAVMGRNPSDFKRLGADAPVENVSWDEVMEFCRKLTERERAADRLPDDLSYTLPTEAQWEFACRAGTTGAFAGTGRIDDMAWYSGNDSGSPHPVGRKRQNAWGLFDMHGNVWEWCADWHASRLKGGSVRDPLGPASGTHRVFRGGCWFNAAVRCRSAYRFCHEPGRRGNNLGFRLALVNAG